VTAICLKKINFLESIFQCAIMASKYLSNNSKDRFQNLKQ